VNAMVKPVESAPADEGATLLAVIARAAADPGVDMDKMERLLAMKERVDARNAETEFNDSMSHVQSQMRRIEADAVNPQTRSKYATYGQLDRALRPIYTSGGFALSFNTGDGGPAEYVRVLCHVTHKAGHTRMYKIDMPADGKGAKGNDVMTKTHAVGSGAQYGMRYLLKMIFNVAIGENDDDGNGGETAEYLKPEFADWNSKVDACHTAQDFAAVWKEMSPPIRKVFAERVKTLKAERVQA
jgi:hypothetical protein